MKLSIIIVNFNTYEFTCQCLDSIANNPPASNYEIIVVDNGSTDGSASRLSANFSDIELVRSARNQGIAGGNNIGIKASSGQYVLLLNNDTIVLPGVIDQAVHFMRTHPEAGGVGGQLLNEDGSFQSGHFDFPNLWQLFMIVSKMGQILRSYYPSNTPGDQIEEVEWISTAFMLFDRRALEEVNYVDEEFFIYSDESDLQYRLRRAEWRIYYHPGLKTIHYGGKSLTPWVRRKLVYRGYLLFFQKHYGWASNVTLRGLFIAISTFKLPIWASIYLFGDRRERARRELSSNLAILAMSLSPGLARPN